jgi:hypothetical protein
MRLARFDETGRYNSNRRSVHALLREAGSEQFSNLRLSRFEREPPRRHFIAALHHNPPLDLLL